MRWLADRLRFWMLGVVVGVLALLELVTGLPGWWALVGYGGAALLVLAIMVAVIDREGGPTGGPMGKRSDFRHGNDMHGHYR